MSKQVTLLLLALCLILVAGCTQENNGIVAPDTAEQLPAEAQSAIEVSQADLAQRLEIEEEAIALDSITAPAAEDGTYVVRLAVGDELYEYHVRNGEVV